MIVQQIGNGGAFDYNKTNSSFLINLSNEKFPLYLLFDCGNNVFAKLRKMEVEQNREIIKYIDYVFISHFDDDHDGSLKTLGYYRYFMLGKTTNILCNPLSSELAERLKGINKKIIFGNFRPAEIFNFAENLNNLITNVGFKIIKGTHHTEAYGLLVGKVFSGIFINFVYISGDTKVNENIIEIMENVKATIAHAEYLPLTHDIDLLKNSYKIFHDYSHWDNYDQQSHTCKYDFDKYYGQFIEDGVEINKYHTGDEYNKNPIILNSFPTGFKHLREDYKKYDTEALKRILDAIA